MGMFGQTFQIHDIAVIGLLVVLEGVLSIDNALVLGLLAKPLPQHMQKRALTYGLVGALVFRLIAITTATFLMQIRIAKLLGGAYLGYVAAKHFFFEKREASAQTAGVAGLVAGEKPCPSAVATPTYRFWSTVVVIELTDIAFAVDSILAAVGLVANREKTWVVFFGGMIGVILMRYAAVLFIRMLERFPRFEVSAYLLVATIGCKLILDWLFNTDARHPRLDFHSPSHLVFWVFWLTMAACFCIGFVPTKRPGKAEEPQATEPPDPAVIGTEASRR
jgi:YkoY family integral membrane protein